MEIKLVNTDNFNEHSLDDFDRFQEVKNCYRLIKGQLTLVYNPFTETWSPERKLEKAEEILSGEYITYCAFEEGRVVGEIMLVPELDHGRLIVDSFHVSRDCRRGGIGRALFNTAIEEAKRKRARGLYISAMSAEETIGFYQAMGCYVSRNPIKLYADDEPYDIQMEYSIG